MAIVLHHLAGKSIGVFGLARSGLATVRAAVAGGASRVTAYDDRAEACEEGRQVGAEIVQPDAWPWHELDCLVLAPGVPLTHPAPHDVVGLAHGSGTPIISDIELLYREHGDDAVFFAITGTNGKSTTTALIGHVLAALGHAAHVGGNIGRAALDLSSPATGGSARTIYALELSSYQLDLCDRFRPKVAIWLNLTPDHLDRHGGFEGYRAAKERLFRQQTADDVAIVGIDDDIMRTVARTLVSKARPLVRTVAVTCDSDADLSVDRNGVLRADGAVIGDLSKLPALRGAHNWQNAACAFEAVRALGGDRDAIMTAMQTFPGLRHRMQVLERRGRVLYVNDSKATNADAAARSLATFQPIYWIAGGRAKDGGIASLSPYFERIAKAYLIGEAADSFSASLAGRLPHTLAGDLETAVPLAAADAALDPADEPVVLLSPAAASFDQFSDFEARGEAFATAVRALSRPANEEVYA